MSDAKLRAEVERNLAEKRIRQRQERWEELHNYTSSLYEARRLRRNKAAAAERIRKLKEKNFPIKAQQIFDILKAYVDRETAVGKAWLGMRGGLMSNAISTIDQQAGIATAQDMCPAVRQRVDAMVATIDLEDTASFLNFGVAELRQHDDEAGDVLSNVRSKDIPAIGQELTKMVGMVKGLDTGKLPTSGDGWFGNMMTSIRGGVQAVITQFESEFTSVSNNVKTVSGTLEAKTASLLGNINNIEKVYQSRVAKYNTYCELIAAANIVIQDIREKQLPPVIEAAQGGDDAAALKANDLNERLAQMERKVAEYNGFRMATLGALAQFRKGQSMAYNLADKIQTAVTGMIPMWEDQMIIAINNATLGQSTEALETLSDATNTMVVEQMEQFKDTALQVQATIETPLLSASTVKGVNDAFIKMIEGVVEISTQGRVQRALDANELAEEEMRLKNALISGAKVMLEHQPSTRNVQALPAQEAV